MSEGEGAESKGALTREQFDSRLKLLRFKRDQFRRTICTAFSIAQELDDSGSEICVHSKLEMFLVRCSQLETVYSEFRDAQTKILEYCHNCNKADVFSVDMQVGEEVEEKYYFILSISRRAVNPSNTNELTRVDNGPTPSTKSRLPTIELPRFSGAFSDWVGFRDLFKSVVHDRTDIASVEKFTYLKKSLQGKALALIASVPFGDAHYDSTCYVSTMTILEFWNSTI
ncbi:hypothetical protein J437_LFUL013941 [Ladona fulva]|uniref:Uncharacterized protein n=1 Tax=Ladona fulva TaxID=123851 RepID=A0A8K0KJR8_LADFU|nr:hypothetical protein J437_LFUL013941 [Ladona fulva]